MATIMKSVAPTAARGYSPSAGDNVGNAGNWTCTAQVPDKRGTRRVQCDTQNYRQYGSCVACGAPKSDSNHTKNTKGTTMATTNKPSTKLADSKPTADAKPATVKPATPSAATAQPTPAAPAPAAAVKATTPATPPGATTDATGREVELGGRQPDKYKGLPRMRFYSVKPGSEDYCVRILPIFFEKYGAPRDPWGEEMKLRPKQAKEFAAGGEYKPAKVARAEAKESREKLLAAMTDEQKLAFVTKERAERTAQKAEKQAAMKAALMAELRKELEAEGKVVKS